MNDLSYLSARDTVIPRKGKTCVIWSSHCNRGYVVLGIFYRILIIQREGRVGQWVVDVTATAAAIDVLSNRLVETGRNGLAPLDTQFKVFVVLVKIVEQFFAIRFRFTCLAPLGVDGTDEAHNGHHQPKFLAHFARKITTVRSSTTITNTC